MNTQVLIALTGALVSMALSATVPCLLKRTDEPLLKEIRKVFETNRQVIIASSIVIGIIIYLSIELVRDMQNDELFVSESSSTPTFEFDPRMFLSSSVPKALPAGLPNQLKQILLRQ